MDDLVAGRQHEFEHVVYEAINVAAGDFGVVALAGQDAPVLQTFDVLTGDANVHRVQFHAGVALADFDGFADGADRFFDVRDHAAQHTDTFDLADSDDFEFAMCIFAAGEAADFRRANV